MQLTRHWALGKGFKPTCVSFLLSLITCQINSVNIGFTQSASIYWVPFIHIFLSLSLLFCIMVEAISNFQDWRLGEKIMYQKTPDMLSYNMLGDSVGSQDDHWFWSHAWDWICAALFANCIISDTELLWVSGSSFVNVDNNTITTLHSLIVKWDVCQTPL